MQQTINIDLIKENPELFFSQLPKKAEKEITEFLYFIIYKYNLKLNFEKAGLTEASLLDKKEFLSFLKKGFSVSEAEIKKIEQTQKQINKWIIQEF